MSKLTSEEEQLIQIVRDLKVYETIELKRNEKGEIVYIFTKKEKHIFLTSNDA